MIEIRNVNMWIECIDRTMCKNVRNKMRYVTPSRLNIDWFNSCFVNFNVRSAEQVSVVGHFVLETLTSDIRMESYFKLSEYALLNIQSNMLLNGEWNVYDNLWEICIQFYLLGLSFDCTISQNLNIFSQAISMSVVRAHCAYIFIFVQYKSWCCCCCCSKRADGNPCELRCDKNVNKTNKIIYVYGSSFHANEYDRNDEIDQMKWLHRRPNVTPWHNPYAHNKHG